VPEQAFRWGIVGTGAIARQFTADLKYAPGADVAAVFSRGAESGEAFGKITGAGKVYTAYDAMLADPRIDAIYIATPNNRHAGQAIAALDAGKPVLVEKPLATTVGEAEAIAASAAKSGGLVMEGLWTRFLPAVAAVRAMLAEGAVGEVVRIEGELAYAHAEEPGSRFFDPALGGGVALDLGVYLLSLAIDLLGVPEKIDGRWKAAASGVDCRTDFFLCFPNGVEAALSCGFDRDGTNAFTIFGKKGAIRLNPPFLKAQRVTLFSTPLTGLADVGGLTGKVLAHLPLPGKTAKNYTFPGGGLQFEADAFAGSVRQGARQNSVMPLEDSIAVLKIIEAVKALPPENSR
jgi:predicted dehydrogenase